MLYLNNNQSIPKLTCMLRFLFIVCVHPRQHSVHPLSITEWFTTLHYTINIVLPSRRILFSEMSMFKNKRYLFATTNNSTVGYTVFFMSGNKYTVRNVITIYLLIMLPMIEAKKKFWIFRIYLITPLNIVMSVCLCSYVDRRIFKSYTYLIRNRYHSIITPIPNL